MFFATHKRHSCLDHHFPLASDTQPNKLNSTYIVIETKINVKKIAHVLQQYLYYLFPYLHLLQLQYSMYEYKKIINNNKQLYVNEEKQTFSKMFLHILNKIT